MKEDVEALQLRHWIHFFSQGRKTRDQSNFSRAIRGNGQSTEARLVSDLFITP